LEPVLEQIIPISSKSLASEAPTGEEEGELDIEIDK
jgi:hypothetical protein